MQSIFRAAVLDVVALAVVGCEYPTITGKRADAMLKKETRAPSIESDLALREKVRKAIAVSAPVPAYGVEVAVSENRVTLYGSVDTPAAQKRFGILTAGVVGVKGVENRIQVDPRY